MFVIYKQVTGLINGSEGVRRVFNLLIFLHNGLFDMELIINLRRKQVIYKL